MMEFSELKFKPHQMSGGKHAKVDFENGYGASVVFGDMFYSDGISTYEIAVMKGGSLCYDTPITDDVLGRLSPDEITEVLEQIEALPKAG